MSQVYCIMVWSGVVQCGLMGSHDSPPPNIGACLEHMSKSSTYTHANLEEVVTTRVGLHATGEERQTLVEQSVKQSLLPWRRSMLRVRQDGLVRSYLM